MNQHNSPYPTLKPKLKSEKFQRQSSTVSSNYRSLRVIDLLAASRFPVFLVYSKNQSQYFAVKLFPYSRNKISTSYTNQKRFLELTHPNIAQIYDHCDFKETFHENKHIKASYVLMELAPFGDFCQLMKKVDLHHDQILARTFFHQLILGIEYLHKQGVAHLDLKLDNLLVGNEYLLKITDFDHTFQTGDDRVLGRGTRGYRAPEIMFIRCKDPIKADIYSAGIILFALQSGKMPYSEPPKEQLQLFSLGANKSLYSYLFQNPLYFWKIHELDASYDNSFKKLFIDMTQYDPLKRITIDQVKKSEWYNGPVFDKEQLKQAMYGKVSNCLSNNGAFDILSFFKNNPFFDTQQFAH